MNRSSVKSDLTARIHSIEGHLAKVEEMVGDKRIECGKILEQTYAISCAVKSLEKLIIVNHFKNCENKDKCDKHDKFVENIVEFLEKRR